MIVEILFCLVAVISALALFFLQADPVESEIEPKICESKSVSFHQILPPTVSKEVIMAMAQRSIYQLVEQTDEECHVDGEDDDIRWAHDLMANSCVKLDANQTNVLELERIVNTFCDRIEKMIDAYEVNLCKYNEELALITDIRLSIEEEIYQSKAACQDQQQPTAMLVEDKVDDDYHHDEENFKMKTSIECPVSFNGTEDDFLFVCNQFVDDNLKILPFINERDSIQDHQ